MTPLRSLPFIVLTLVIGTSASAQQRPIFDPDDFVDPRQHEGVVFAFRLVLGGASNLDDDYRPVHHDATFALLTNSFYWSAFQFDYKHSEVRAGGAPSVVECRCPNPIYFPTPPPPGSEEFLFPPLPPKAGMKTQRG
jgi:hypothetical protein